MKKKEFIEKASKWLRDNAVDYMIFDISEELSVLKSEDLVDDFQKAMEE